MEYTYNNADPRVGWGVVAKIDNGGCMLWKRNYQNSPDGTQSARLYNVKTTPDGGYLTVGTNRLADSTFQNGWAVKTDEWGCVEPGCQNIIISDCDGITPVENPQLEEWKINVFPNPFGDKVTFDLQGILLNEEVLIQASDLSGKRIWQKQIKGQNQIEWQPSNISRGMYFYKIKTEDGKTQEGKLIYIQ